MLLNSAKTAGSLADCNKVSGCSRIACRACRLLRVCWAVSHLPQHPAPSPPNSASNGAARYRRAPRVVLSTAGEGCGQASNAVCPPQGIHVLRSHTPVHTYKHTVVATHPVLDDGPRLASWPMIEPMPRAAAHSTEVWWPKVSKCRCLLGAPAERGRSPSTRLPACPHNPHSRKSLTPAVACLQLAPHLVPCVLCRVQPCRTHVLLKLWVGSPPFGDNDTCARLQTGLRRTVQS